MQDFFAALLQKNLIMVTGKGGIGKTLSSVALALKARSQGKRVCIVESSAHDQLAPLFGSEPVGHNLRELLPGISVINLNPQDNFRDFVIKHLGFAKLFEKVFTKPLVRSFIQTLPGISELTLLGRLYYFCELDREERFDLVILDGFASGHFLSLMKTPDAVLNSGMIGPIIDETRRVRDYIANPEKTAVALVTVPEDLVVGEALDFTARLQRESPAKVAALILNRCFPGVPAGATDLSLTPALLPGLDYWSHRAQSEQQSRQRLKEGLARIPREDGRAWPVYLLPERGAFDEPLDPQLMNEWLKEASQL